MSLPPVSARTLVRDAVVQGFQSRQDTSLARVQKFGVSLKYLNPQETKQGNTYCILMSEETPERHTQTQRNWQMEMKIVCYANHPEDPHAIIDAMIEDAQDAMSLMREHQTVKDLVWNVRPVSITVDERTTEAGPWGQAVCTWMMDHCRH